MRTILRVDPNDRLEPPPLTFFDLADGFLMLSLVNRLGFSESCFQFAGDVYKRQPFNWPRKLST